jgi:CBS domain-containing protein
MNRTVTVGDLMSRPVRRLPMRARVPDAIRFLRKWRIRGAPVLDSQGRPVGVFSFTDLAAAVMAPMVDVPVPGRGRSKAGGEFVSPGWGSHFEGFDDSRISDVMSPGILCVDPRAPLADVLRLMERRSIHRVFVRKGAGPLEGVLTTMDVMRWLRVELKPRRRHRKPARVG